MKISGHPAQGETAAPSPADTTHTARTASGQSHIHESAAAQVAGAATLSLIHI